MAANDGEVSMQEMLLIRDEQIGTLVTMGFSAKAAAGALGDAKFETNKAIELLLQKGGEYFEKKGKCTKKEEDVEAETTATTAAATPLKRKEPEDGLGDAGSKKKKPETLKARQEQEKRNAEARDLFRDSDSEEDSEEEEDSSDVEEDSEEEEDSNDSEEEENTTDSQEEEDDEEEQEDMVALLQKGAIKKKPEDKPKFRVNKNFQLEKIEDTVDTKMDGEEADVKPAAKAVSSSSAAAPKPVDKVVDDLPGAAASSSSSSAVVPKRKAKKEVIKVVDKPKVLTAAEKALHAKLVGKGKWKAPTKREIEKTSTDRLKQQRHAVTAAGTNLSSIAVPNNITFEPVPKHYMPYGVKNPLMKPTEKARLRNIVQFEKNLPDQDKLEEPQEKPSVNLTCKYNGTTGEVKAEAQWEHQIGEKVFDATLPLNINVCKDAIKRWWYEGVEYEESESEEEEESEEDSEEEEDESEDEEEESEEEEEEAQPQAGGGNGDEFDSRFDFLHTGDARTKNVFGTKLFLSPDGWNNLILERRDRWNGFEECVTTSLDNVKSLQPKVIEFLSQRNKKSFDRLKCVTGVIDEKAISSLGLPVALMQDPKKFGTALSRAGVKNFDQWKTFDDDFIKTLDTFDKERDMKVCLTMSCLFEEKLQSQAVSNWFWQGLVPEAPFLGQIGADLENYLFCENCGNWHVHEKPTPQQGKCGRIAADHVLQCVNESRRGNKKWKMPDEDKFSRTGGDYLQTLRLFQQTTGADIGATLQFKYVSKDKVSVQLHAPFKSLLRRMMYMNYWEHDGVTARWRMVKDQDYENEVVTTDHRGAPKKFKMKNSLDMPAAATPPCFLHTLKGQQPYTLSWLFAREGRTHDGKISAACTPEAFKSKQLMSRRIAGSDVKLEVEVERSFDRVRGGILGDSVGYGKTACMIGLVAQSHLQDPIQPTMKDWEQPYAQEHIFTNATLIITPPNLFDQWLGEFKKFVDNSKLKLKICDVVDAGVMKRKKMKDFAEADVVLVSFRFFFSCCYREWFDDQTDFCTHQERAFLESRELTKPEFLVDYSAKRILKCRHRILKHMKDDTMEQLLEKPALFEAFYWKRIVFDEFHEVVKSGMHRSCVPSLANFFGLRSLHSRYHWGLTATPLLDNATEVAEMASLLHIFLPNNDDSEAQHFVDEYMRANKWDVETIKLTEKHIPVQHTPAERVLYIHQEEEMGDKQRASKYDSAQEKLLQFCTHFAPDREAKTAESAIELIRKANTDKQKQLRQRITELDNQFAGLIAKEALVEKFKLFVDAVHAKSPNLTRQHGDTIFMHSSAAELETLMAGWHVGQEASIAMCQLFADKINFIFANRHQQLGGFHFGPAQYRATCYTCSPLYHNGGLHGGGLAHVMQPYHRDKNNYTTQIKNQQGALAFFDKRVKEVLEETKKEQKGEEEGCCSVCLEEIEPEQMMMTRCGHTFCADCLKEVCNNNWNSMCPECRQPIRLDQCMTHKDIEKHKNLQGEKKIDKRRVEVGSKIFAIVQLLEKIRDEGNGDKVIIFIQWDSIRDTLTEMIYKAMGFHPHVLKGGLAHRTNVLRDFNDGEGEKDQVLVLSLEQSTSGMNLFAANHCIFVHPMFGEHACDKEHQAIGRIRRQGQMKDCFLYRFYTKNTIEEKLMKEHSKVYKIRDNEEQQLANNNTFLEPKVTPLLLNAHTGKQAGHFTKKKKFDL